MPASATTSMRRSRAKTPNEECAHQEQVLELVSELEEEPAAQDDVVAGEDARWSRLERRHPLAVPEEECRLRSRIGRDAGGESGADCVPALVEPRQDRIGPPVVRKAMVLGEEDVLGGGLPDAARPRFVEHEPS